MAFFSSLGADFFCGKINSIKGFTLESFLFFVQSIKKPVCVILDRNTIESVSVLLQEEVGKTVACVLAEKPLLAGFENFYNTISKISIQSLSCKSNIDICFIEASVLHVPCFSVDAPVGFVVDRNCSFGELKKRLLFFGFSQKNSGVSKPGDFYINGGVVDVWPFGGRGLYRISFLEEWCSIYLVELTTNKIASSLRSLVLYPFVVPGPVTPSVFLKNAYFFSVYEKGVLFKKGGLTKKGACLSVQVIDYRCFIKKHRTKKINKLSFNSEKGFIVTGEVCVPPWFYKKRGFVGAVKRGVLDGFASLDVGSFYVHEDFGLCRFIGLEAHNKQERVCLQFLDGLVKLDIYYISKLSFYSHETPHKLNYLNRPGLWKKQKQKATLAAEEYVKNIINTYSKREAVQSSRLNVSDPFIEDFVRSFKHQDTKDQRKCWEDILKDFNSNTPMNRLVCGDVGFGKTEIALRASFLSVLNEQQVLVLAPTTILSNQLYHSFVSRLSDFGVVVGLLSRLSLKKTGVVEAFLNKKTDVLIGTSSLLFKPSLLRQCGLFVVDEEHRFGVKKKELVLSLNPAVNFLSLSATPIPRSLQLSLSNVRSLSLIQTPPVERKPIISFVHFFDLGVVCGSILKEVERGGQVFFVDNSVDNLKKTLALLERKLPFLSFGIVYSNLNKNILLKTMGAFVSGKTQVLLSTTIIESGIDIGLANTIIINNAHLFGLSQLYQLRGRVGRSSLQAFAWFLIPKKKQTPQGRRRLKSIIKNSALGAGYSVALSDLDIRGSGSLFGYKQSGGGGVGFEYYTKLLGLVVRKRDVLDCVVSLFGEGLSSLILNEGQRGYFYKVIFSAQTLEELKQIKLDIVAFFGVCPKPFLSLLQNRELGLLGIKKRIVKIVKNKGFVVVVFGEHQNKGFVGFMVSYITSFFKKKNISFQFINTKKKFSFQYQSVEENDYILLLSFINKISF